MVLNSYTGIFISIALSLVQIFSVQAYSSSSDPLAQYQKRLNELNRTLETSYALLPDENVSDEEMTRFYQKMSISEFDDYIHSLHDADMEFRKNEWSITQQEISVSDNALEKKASDHRQTQKFYYSADNCLYVVFKLRENARGKKFYDGVEETGQRHSSYPAYEVCGHSYTPYDNAGQALITFHCTKHLSRYLADTGSYDLSCTFKAGEGYVAASCFNMLVPVKIEQNHYIRFDKMRKFPDIVDKKLYIYHFETDTQWDLSLESKWEDLSFFIGQDGHYGVYIIPDKDKGLIADVGSMIYVTEFNEESGGYLTNKLSY